MKGIVVFKGKYGSTAQYAKWVGEALHVPVVTSEEISETLLQGFDTIIIGSAVYMGKLLIKDWLKQHQEMLRNKKLFLFGVCGTPSSEYEKLREIVRTSVPPVLLNQCNVQFFRGRMILKNLSWLDRFLLRMGARLQKDPAAKQEMLKEFDAVKKESLTDLLTY